MMFTANEQRDARLDPHAGDLVAAIPPNAGGILYFNILKVEDNNLYVVPPGKHFGWIVPRTSWEKGCIFLLDTNNVRVK